MKKAVISVFILIVSTNAFAKGAKDFSRSLYLENNSEEIIREAVLLNSNVKEIAGMYYLQTNIRKYRMYLLMKDETKIVLDSVRILEDNSIIGSLWRLGDYTDPAAIQYDKSLNRYIVSRIYSQEYLNEKYEEFVHTWDINLILNNYEEIKEFFASLPCLTSKDCTLMKEGRYKEIESLQHLDWKKIKDDYFSGYIVEKADDFSWSQWKVNKETAVNE